MQRLEWHCHTKSVSGALYKAVLFHSQSAGKEMANSAVFQFPAERRQWLNFPARSWKGIPGTRRMQQPETHDPQWWLDVSVVRRVSTSKQSGDDDVLVYISRRLKCLSKVRWRRLKSTMECFNQSISVNLYCASYKAWTNALNNRCKK